MNESAKLGTISTSRASNLDKVVTYKLYLTDLYLLTTTFTQGFTLMATSDIHRKLKFSTSVDGILSNVLILTAMMPYE